MERRRETCYGTTTRNEWKRKRIWENAGEELFGIGKDVGGQDADNRCTGSWSGNRKCFEGESGRGFEGAQEESLVRWLSGLVHGDLLAVRCS